MFETSKFLQEQLGKCYNPETHWTSGMRNRAGYTTFSGSRLTHSAFTISTADCTEALTTFLVKNQYLNARSWQERSLTYHMEVAATIGNAQSCFALRVAQFERVCLFNILHPRV
jgi:hypothetical protein